MLCARREPHHFLALPEEARVGVVEIGKVLRPAERISVFLGGGDDVVDAGFDVVGVLARSSGVEDELRDVLRLVGLGRQQQRLGLDDDRRALGDVGEDPRMRLRDRARARHHPDEAERLPRRWQQGRGGDRGDDGRARCARDVEAAEQAHARRPHPRRPARRRRAAAAAGNVRTRASGRTESSSRGAETRS